MNNTKTIEIDKAIVNELKVAYYERWNTEDYKYLSLQVPSGNICFTNNLDCDGNIYFCHKSFLKRVAKLQGDE